MQDPAMILPDAMKGIQLCVKATGAGGVPQKTLELVHIRASQINGCSACVEYGIGAAGRSGEALGRLVRLLAWRESDCFSDAERAALGSPATAAGNGRRAAMTRCTCSPTSSRWTDTEATKASRRGLPATVGRRDTDIITNQLDRPVGWFADGCIRCSPLAIEKLDTWPATPSQLGAHE
jgi:AhpD family alkylhydroperoxidase